MNYRTILYRRRLVGVPVSKMSYGKELTISRLRLFSCFIGMVFYTQTTAHNLLNIVLLSRTF